MGFLNLNLYKHPSGVAFDAAKVIEHMKATFPDADFPPGDRALAEVQRAEAFFATELAANPNSPARSVVESLRRKAANYGPSYAFAIPRSTGKPITGCARSVGVTFLFEDPLTEDWRNRLIAFLKSLAIGQLETSTEHSATHEVLEDLRGPSPFVRNDVPWLSKQTPDESVPA